MRVVSLVPSLTETLLAFGVQPVACTRFCEQPTLTHVGGTKDPDIDAIVALAPDVVFMDREENRREDAELLRDRGVEVFATHVASIDDVAPMMRDVAERLGMPQPQSLPHPSSPVDSRRADADPTPAFVAIWRRPWMTINDATYGSSLLASIGVSNVFGNHADPYPTVDLADVAARRPTMVLLPSEPYPFRRRHIDELLDALGDVDVRLIDGQDLFWWGVRTAQAQSRLRGAIAQPM